MHVHILGAGMIGLTSAYMLRKAGYSVSIVDRQPGPGLETSYANGGQLSYCRAEPWANPDSLKKMPVWMFRKDAPLYFHWQLSPDFWRWSLQFIRQCSRANTLRNTERMFRISAYSRDIMHSMVAETGLSFDYQQRGILYSYACQSELEKAFAHMTSYPFLAPHLKQLNQDACLAHEPCLSGSREQIAGGILATLDETGDAFDFCKQLAEWLAEMGVRFHYNTSITGLRAEQGQLRAIETSNGDIPVEAAVLALGVESPFLVKKLGIRLPIYPLKGYSITLPANAHSPIGSITDESSKIVYTGLGPYFRISGTAETAGYDTSPTPYRLRIMLEEAQRFFPNYFANIREEQLASRREWACLRPATPFGTPIIGKSPVSNLFLNVGHGALGWTMAAGSAALLTDLMTGEPPGINPEGLTYAA